MMYATIRLPEERLGDLRKKLTRLAKRAAKIGQ